MAEGSDRGGGGESTISVSMADRPARPADGLTLSPGDRIGGRYRIVRFIARGAMGEVYAAFDHELDATVALKTLRSERADDAVTLARFRREVLLTRELAHPGVCRVFDLGVHEIGDAARLLFLTMELIEGETLAQRLARVGPLPPDAVIALAEKLASALSAAHAAGVVHRDLKPANIMLMTGSRSSSGERVVITDFGLARRTSVADAPLAAGDSDEARASLDSGGGVTVSAAGSGRPFASTSATATGALIGSPAYMAPEQVAGREIGPAADIYSLGVVLFETVSGRLPFQADSALAMAAMRLDRDAPPVRSVRPDLDPRWDRVLATCLARDPAARFARADEVPRALLGSPGPRRRTGWWRIAVGGAAAVALTGAAVAALISAGGTDVAPSRIAAPADAPLLAVVPLRNLSTRPESAWLGTAVAEILSTELGAGERLRVVPSDQVGAAARARGVELDGADEGAAGALGGALSADYVLSGSVVAVGDGTRVRVELRLRDGTTGKLVTQLGADGGEAELFSIVSRLGADVRARLGRGPLNAAEQAAASSAHPQSIEAARAYAEGVAALGRYEAQLARSLFERAIELEPDRARYHAGLASAWRALQFPERARQAAQRAFALSDGLPQPERMFNEARHHQTARRFDRAIEIYSALATFFPENQEYRISLAEVESEAGRPRAVLVTVDRLRAGGASDPRIDLLEAGAARQVADQDRAVRAALAARDKARTSGAAAMQSIAELRVCEVLTARDFEQALAACRTAAKESEALGDRATVARALMQTAYIRERQDARAEAEELVGRALTIFQEIGNVRGVGLALDRMGKTLKSQGRLEEAIELQKQALARVRDAGDDLTAATMLEGMASTEVERGRLDEARRLYGEAIALDRKLGNEKGLAIALQNLAWIEHDGGDVIAARRSAEEAMAMQERRGEELDLIYSLDCTAIMALEQDDLATADRLLTRALALREKLKVQPVATLQNMAEVRMVQGRLDDARALIARSLASTSGGLDEGYAREVEGRILFEAGDLDGAARALARSRELTGDRSRVILDLDEARILVARGQARPAIALLQRAVGGASKSGAITQRIAVEGALGEAELAAGVAGGADRLLRAEREAAARGFSLMARKLAEVRTKRVAGSPRR